MTDRTTREARLKEALVAAFEPVSLEIRDDSHRHAGHAGARDGRGHFKVSIVSRVFAGMTPLQKHRAVYAAVGSMMETDIHALQIDAKAPDQL